MYRPSPQVPKPSPHAAKLCFESSAYMINANARQMEAGVDITWVFILTVNSALNTLLWTVSYPAVRQMHPREEVEELVNIAMDVLDRCAERWPGTASASQLYSIFSKACLQGYDSTEAGQESDGFFTSPPSFADHNSPPDAYSQNNNQQAPFLNAPQFNHVFNSPLESMNTYGFDPNFPSQPTFRSNSIFCNPASNEPTGRRFSYFPPNFTQGEAAPDDPTPPATTTPEALMTSPSHHMSEQLPTPPDTIPTGNITTPSNTLSPSNTMTTQHASIMPNTSPAVSMAQLQNHMSPSVKVEPSQQGNIFSVPPLPQHQVVQRSLPTPNSVNDWFSPPPPFITPYAMANMSNSFFNDAMSNSGNYGDMSGAGLGLQNPGVGPMGAPQFDYGFARQGSLTQSQQLELMNVLETEGLGDIDAFLNTGVVPNSRWY